MTSLKQIETDNSSGDEDESPCPVCNTRKSNRRLVHIPKKNETYRDKECGYCGAILRLFARIVTQEELEKKYIGKRYIKVCKVEEEPEGDDKIKIEYRRM